MDELLARHRKEQKDLVAHVTALKKQASKKTRKAVNTKCSDLQSSLEARQRDEIDRLGGAPPDAVSPAQLLAAMSVGTEAPDQAETPETSEESARNSPAPAKRRNRAKERLARRQAQIDAVQAEAHEEAANSVDYRAIEAQSMQSLLSAQGLQLHEIQPDGHCLFASIQDQLSLRHSHEAGAPDLSVAALRKRAADHIRAHPDAYTPYLFDPQSMTLRDVGQYTEELEHTAMWGSDLEIAALAAVYECPIKVLVAGSAPIVFNEAGENPQLVVAYFKHSYGLGEHYNSCRDVAAARV